MAYGEGLFTGLLGYALRKEFLGDVLYYREVETFNYDIYSLDFSGVSPTTIQNAIYAQFTQFSGNINCKVFQVPGDFTFPGDSRRAAKFNVSVEAKHVPTGLFSSEPELGTTTYTGIDYNFWNQYGTILMDFREEFDFGISENGNQTYNHSISFALRSGGSPMAANIASYLFAADDNTNFGISVLPSGIGASLAASGMYQQYYTEVYDIARNIYNFSSKREQLPESGNSFSYDLIHTLEMKDDGIIDVNEHGNVRGNLTFDAAKAGADGLIANAYNRCNSFFENYDDIAGSTQVVNPLINAPSKTLRLFNRKDLTADYDISYTNNPRFHSDSSLTEETITFDSDEKGLVDIRHNFNFTYYKRGATNPLLNMIANAYATSPATVSGYYANSSFFNAGWPVLQIHQALTYPARKNKASVELQYSNNIKFFRVINGVLFQYLTYEVNNTKPVDIISEYKVVNRPNQISVVNYAYQTEKGQMAISFEAGIGRIPNEFTAGFRSNLGPFLKALYKYGGTVFLQQFAGIVPISFTYYLSDVKYSLDSDGVIQLVLTYDYTLKKYIV